MGMQRRLSGNAATSTLPITVTVPSSPPNHHHSFFHSEQSRGGSPSAFHRLTPSVFSCQDTNSGFARHASGFGSPTLSSLRAAKSRCSSSTPSWLPKLTVAALMIIMFIAGGQISRRQMNQDMETAEELRNTLEASQRKLLHELHMAQRKAADSSEEHKLRDMIMGLRKEKQDLKNLLDDQIEKSERAHQEEGHSDSYEQQLKKETAEEIKGLTAGIQRLSRDQAIEHFGSGPHYVQFEIEMPSEKGTHSESAYFTIELASLNLMPTTVNMFLRAVSKGLWDNAHFSMNAVHVIMGEPSDVSMFHREGVAHLPFREHSESFPHLPYTLGLAGDPAGPAFYVNKIDNNYSHGLHAEEPCFAHVIIGTETIDRMAQQPSHSKNPNAFENPVKIISARIMDLHEVHGGEDFLNAVESTEE